MLTALITKGLGPFLIIGIMALAATGLGWLAIASVNTLVDNVRTIAISERDAYWKGQIAISNAASSDERSRQFEKALAAESAANLLFRDLTAQKSSLENDNAALPNGSDCGLDHRRVRLLAK